MRDMDVSLLTEVNKILPDPEPEPEANVEPANNTRSKKGGTKK